MITDSISIQVEGSKEDSCLQLYLIDESGELKENTRPMILLCPGGGYEWTSDREAEVLALQFLAMGYHAAVLRYSTTPAVYPTALLELAKAMMVTREHAKEWRVDAEKIVVLGCSAGGHLAASLGVFWHEEWIAKKLATTSEAIKPFGMILCYPVISSGEFAHRGSFDLLLKGIETPKLLEKVSLEKQVTEKTVQTFLWHTFTDGTVPVENSLMFATALKKANVSTEFHMYPVGGHGLSTAKKITRSPWGDETTKECQSWLPMVEMWLDRIFE